MRRLLSQAIFAAALLALAPARAQTIYRYVDDDGVMVVTNVPRGAKKARAAKASVDLAKSSVAAEGGTGRPSDELAPHIQEACSLYRIPPPLVRAIMAAESNFDPKAVSSRGAMGLMQLMPETASEMFVADVFDPKQNILGGVRYLRVLANMFDGDMVQIVAAYNAGPDAVKRAGGIPVIAETQEYVKKVLRLYFAYKSET